MQPDFTKLKPADQTQPDFAKLSPAVQRVVNMAPQQSLLSKVASAADLPGAATVRGIASDTLKNTYQTYQNTPSEIASAIQDGANTMSQGGVANFLKGAGQSALGTASAAVSAIFAPVSSAFSSVLQRSGAQGAIDQAGQAIGNKISDVPAVQKFAIENPNAEKYISQGLNVGMGVIGGNEPITAKGLKEAAKTIPETTMNASLAGASIADSIYNSIKNGNPTDLDKKVLQYYEKGVRPSVAGKTTIGQLDAYNQKALQALDTIASNKNKLQLTNAEGQVESKLPSTLNEFTQAIDQTKKDIFQKYDAMAKQSGEAGAQVNLEPIAAELDVIANDPKLKTFSPSSADYAGKLAERMRNQGYFSPADIQDSIKMLNDKLQAFYRNPSPEGASNASIDAVMANKLREALDNTIGSYTGPGYQSLKNQYGSLSTIEKDVVRRAIVDARKNVKGLLDFTDIASGAEAVHAILTTSPQGLATAGAMKAIKEYYKYLNDPNTSVNKLFKTIEKAKSGSSNVISPSGKLQLPQSQVRNASTKATPFKSFVKNPQLGLAIKDITKDYDTVAKALMEYDSSVPTMNFGKGNKMAAPLTGDAATLADLKAKLEKGVLTKEEIATAGRLLQKEGAFGNPLLEQAKNAKTLDEFVKAQFAIYHGTPNKFSRFSKEKMYGGRAWFSDSKKAVEANNVEASRPAGAQWNVMERYLKPDVKIADMRIPEIEKLVDNEYTDSLIAKGYRGIRHKPDELRGSYVELFFPNEDTLTRSKLTEIWKQAHPESSFSPEVQRIINMTK